MDVSGVVAWLGVGATWVGVIFAAHSAQQARGSQRQAQAASEEANRIQKELVALERERDERERAASVRARFEVTLQPEGDYTYIVVTNRGPGEARNVRVELKGGEEPVNRFVQDPPDFPIPSLKAGGSAPPLRLSAPRSRARQWVNPVIVEWDHADGTSDRLETNPS